MKTKLKQEYEKQQKKQKAKTIVKWVACGLGWTALLGAFVGLVALGCKGCANKKVDSQNNTRVIGDYTLNKRAFDNLPYKYYYRYEDIFEGYEHWAQSEQITAEFDLRLKYKSNEVAGDNGYYRNLRYFILDINKSDCDMFMDLYGCETNGHIDSSDNLLYSTYFDGQGLNTPDNYIQIGFIDSSIDLLNYSGDNACIGFISNIIKYNAVINMDLRFDFNYQINRYGPLMSSNEVFAKYGQASQLGNSYVVRGYFKDSLDNYYNAIKITYLEAQATEYIDSSGAVKIWDQTGARFLTLEYIRTDNTSVMVNYNDWAIVNNKNLYTNTSTWVSDSFRHLTIFYLDTFTSNLPINNLKPLEVLQTFNNNVVGSDMGGLGGSTGVFGLISQGFSSIASILNMQIIPGISLGLFIFIPFSIMILLACVWLFKR